MNHGEMGTGWWTRRRVLRAGGAGALAGAAAYLFGVRGREAAPGAPAGAVPVAADALAVREPVVAAEGWARSGDGVLRREDFLPFVKESFQLEPGAAACTLVEVGGARHFTGKGVRYAGFSLLFHGPADFSASAEAIYQLSHPRFGEAEVFLSVLRQLPERVVLEAVFSHAV